MLLGKLETIMLMRYLYLQVCCSITHSSQSTWIHTHNEMLSALKEGNSVICDYMDERGRHYAAGNRPGRERQILQGITYVMSLKKKIKVELPGAGGRWGIEGKAGKRIPKKKKDS